MDIHATKKRPKIRKHALPLIIVMGFAGVFFNIQDLNNNNSVLHREKMLFPMPTRMNPNFLNQVEQCFIPTASVYGYTLRITSGFRSGDEQNELFEQGRTIDGHIVTEAPAGKSIHNYGYAVDVVDRWRAFDIDWEKLGRIASFCGIEQGDEGDYPHFEHRGGLTTDDFKEGLRPSKLVLPCALMAERYNNKKDLTIEDLKSCNAPDFNKEIQDP